LESPRSITDGPDGNVWFTLSFTPMIGRITPAGEITFFPTPSNPEQIARGHGNTLLFSEFGPNKIARMTTDGVVTESAEFPNSEPTGITSGPGKSRNRFPRLGDCMT
jgi:virginiamycin B lyase